MKQRIITERYLKCPLGVVRCGFRCDALISLNADIRSYDNGESETFITSGHKIEMIKFKLKMPLYNHKTIADSCGQIFRIEKINDIQESIGTFCLLNSFSADIEFDMASGEHLDAIQANKEDWTLHIGTEDGEILNSRAAKGDWFPPRLRNKDNPQKTISIMRKNGFSSKVPDLYQGEKMYLHYLTAFDNSDERKINTWLAVDQNKKNLEQWIGL